VPFTIAASVRSDYPGAVGIIVTGDPAVQSSITRVDGSLPQQPVRNYSGTGSGLETVTDMEAPLGRAVSYNLLDVYGGVLAQSAAVTCPAPGTGYSLIRSVLKPSVAWMWVEPQDEAAVEWATSTTVHRIPGSDTPIVVGEIRQRRSGTFSFLVRSIEEADRLVSLMRDGTPILLRHSPCASAQTRDLLFYALDVTEVRWGRQGWRRIVVDYASTGFVSGETLEPPFSEGWTMDALRHSANTFAELASLWPTFAAMATEPKPPVWGP
jgi:hypothetical protein